MLRSIDHFIGGSTFASGERQGDVFDPNQGQVQAQVRLGTAADLQKAVDAAKAAQPAWAATNWRIMRSGAASIWRQRSAICGRIWIEPLRPILIGTSGSKRTSPSTPRAGPVVSLPC